MTKSEFLFISGKQLKGIFKLRGKGVSYVSINLDLNRTDKQYRISIIKDGIFFHHFGLLLSWEDVRKFSKKEELLYLVNTEGVSPLLFFKDKVYRILDTNPPSLELDGIRMHTHKVSDDIKSKIEYLRIKPGNLVLDTCAGFGYTAIEVSKFGANVITVEKDPFVVELSRINPYSKSMFTSRNITLIMGDIYEIDFKDQTFDFIVHDPPRLGSKSGYLYSDEIYQKFYRILKPRGVLYHYIGNPGKKYRNKDIPHRVSQRLSNMGFSTKVVPQIQGIIAKKSIYWI
ncbi:MAG: methyltransferase domain-containing protein [Candidatus Calescibacterium sp.]|nr:methyltransferase domain-containing protein [Candidatus Calescibacterium sp.]